MTAAPETNSPDGLDALQPGHQGAGGSLFEIAEGQTQQMTEYLGAQNGVNAIAGVKDEELPQPGHDGGEEHEHQQGDTEHDQGALGLMDHDLVDDDLGEQRRGQAHQLNDEGGKQHVAPDALVLLELRQEPAKAEGPSFGQKTRNFLRLAHRHACFPGDQNQFGAQAIGRRFDGERLRGMASGAKIKQGVAIALEDEDGKTVRDPQESYCRQRQLAPVDMLTLTGAGLEASARAASWNEATVCGGGNCWATKAGSNGMR